MEEEKKHHPQRAVMDNHLCNHPCRYSVQLQFSWPQFLPHHSSQGSSKRHPGKHTGWEEALIIIKEKGRTQRPHPHPPVISPDIICLAHLLK